MATEFAEHVGDQRMVLISAALQMIRKHMGVSGMIADAEIKRAALAMSGVVGTVKRICPNRLKSSEAAAQPPRTGLQ